MPRPVPNFHGFVGNTKLVDQLVAQGLGARSRFEPFPATGLFGPAGHGKRRLMQALASLFGTKLVELDADAPAEDLNHALRYAGRSTWIYIAEAHALSFAAHQLLCNAIDEGRCAVILATDQPGRLRAALTKRLEVTAILRPYRPAELKQIAAFMARDLSLAITAQGRNLIAKMSGGTPRRIEQYLQRLARYIAATRAGHGPVTAAQVRQFLRDNGIDRLGLSLDERRYLRAVGRAGKASPESLSAKLGFDVRYLQVHLETPLLRRDFIQIGHGRRELTELGREWFEASVRRRDARRASGAANAAGRGRAA